jgi:hypothetical protein
LNPAIAKLIGIFAAVVLYAFLVPAGVLALTVIFVPTLLSVWWRSFSIWLMLINVFLGWTGVAYAYTLLWAWQGSPPNWQDCKKGMDFIRRFATLAATPEDVPPRKRA